MSSRQQRRSKSRRDEPAPIIGRTELVAAAVVFTAAALTLGVVLLVSGGGDDDDGSGTVGADTPAATVTGAAFVPDDDAGEAIVELGRRSVEALPNGVWPELYHAFTQTFHDRCPRNEFIAAGEADARAQGDQLQQLSFVKLIDVVISGETATAVIVGSTGASEYTIGAAYTLEDGEWRISPPPDTSGCNGFTRLG